MLIHIANYFEADRRSAVAGEDMALGVVTIASPDASGTQRKLMKVTAAADLKSGLNGIAFKVSAETFQVTSSTVNTDAHLDLGAFRVVSIKSGDQIVEVRRGAMVEYDVSLLDDTLNPGAGVPGVLPAVGAALGIDPTSAKFCDAAKVGAIVAPILGRVFEIRGTTKVVIEILEVA